MRIAAHSATSNIIRVVLYDSSSTTGARLTGLTSSSAGLVVATIADNESSATVYAQASSNIETISTIGTYAAPTGSKCRFKEIDAGNLPGHYEIQLADARYAVASAKALYVSIHGATNLLQSDLEIRLTSADLDDAVNLGLSALPSAAPAANGGMPTVDANNRISGVQGTKNTLDDLNDVSTAQVNAECLDVVATDTISELAQAQPSATPTLVQAVMLTYMMARNALTSASELKIHNDAGTVIAKASLSDDGTTFTRAKLTSGP